MQLVILANFKSKRLIADYHPDIAVQQYAEIYQRFNPQSKKKLRWIKLVKRIKYYNARID